MKTISGKRTDASTNSFDTTMTNFLPNVLYNRFHHIVKRKKQRWELISTVASPMRSRHNIADSLILRILSIRPLMPPVLHSLLCMVIVEQ